MPRPRLGSITLPNNRNVVLVAIDLVPAGVTLVAGS
jgi:hypothetical protein